MPLPLIVRYNRRPERAGYPKTLAAADPQRERTYTSRPVPELSGCGRRHRCGQPLVDHQPIARQTTRSGVLAGSAALAPCSSCRSLPRPVLVSAPTASVPSSARHRTRPPRHRRHRPGRHVRQRSRRRAPSRFSSTISPPASRCRQRRAGDCRHGRAANWRCGAHRRRNRGNAQHVPTDYDLAGFCVGGGESDIIDGCASPSATP